MTAPDYSSPCIKVCTLDPATGLCVGCFRTIEEIAAWTQFSNEERAAIRASLAARRERYPLATPAVAQGKPERCERCGAGFVCGAGAARCWCTSYPPVVPSGTRCLCPECLASSSRGRE